MSVKNFKYQAVASKLLNAPVPSDINHAYVTPDDGAYRVRIREEFRKLPRLAGSTVLFNLGTGYTDTEVEHALLGNTDWELQGTNAANAGATFWTGGGVALQTAGAQNDQMIIAPLSEASVDGGTYNSLVNTVAWDTTKSAWFRTWIKTSASVADIVIWAGWKLTNTSVIATDADQAFFRVAGDASGVGNWTVNDSNTGTDTEYETDIAIAASTGYLLEVKVDAQRYPYYYINHQFLRKGAQLKNSLTTLKPFVGVQETNAGGAAKTIRCSWIDISQDRS